MPSESADRQSPPDSKSIDPIQFVSIGLAVLGAILAVVYMPIDGCTHPGRGHLLLTAFALWAAAVVGLFARIRHKGPGRLALFGAIIVGVVILSLAGLGSLTSPYSSTEVFLDNLPESVRYSSDDIRFMMLGFDLDETDVQCVIDDAAMTSDDLEPSVSVWRKAVDGCGLGDLSTTYCIDPLVD